MSQNKRGLTEGRLLNLLTAACALSIALNVNAAGLSLAEIASILEMRDHGEQTCGHVIELMERHLDDIDRQVRQLRSTRKLLEELTVRAKALDPSACVDPNRCQTIGADSVVPWGVRRATRHAHGSVPLAK